MAHLLNAANAAQPLVAPAIKTFLVKYTYARGKVVQWKSGPPMDGKIAKKSTEHHTSNQENVHQCTVL
jgi:hypothetical protein|tara:strand:- start:237 stop:440 length:204 start_codon:yes stop_codon:yes gene_type:complete